MNTAELREAYLAFFESKGHKRVPSSTLVPHDDPTLLFTNAGMNQFKDPLLGRSNPGYTRATSAQRCVRAGGKHNDLENVGFTARHLTFFEMMGNFSFGDYFKEETIAWAWEFISEVLKIPQEKIWITVHPTDDESRAIWIDKMGIAPDRVVDLEENFWTMGDTGPCGPCTELFYDHGPEVEGGPPGSPDEDGDRYVEFWNLVFPQFDRSADGTLTPLPKPGVDTGMGLERMATVLQHVHSNYEIDLFARLMKAAGKFAGITDEAAVLANTSLRVIADHIRSSAFLVADGVIPGNEDRAYVLRRIIRRALRHGYMLNIEGLFFHKLVDVLAQEMGAAYPVLLENKAHVAEVLKAEEIRFSETLAQGMELLQGRLADIEGDTVPGEVLFQLYDTYGFPVDLTADIAREKGYSVDMPGFDAAMEAQRARGRASASFAASLSQRINVPQPVVFSGYEHFAGESQVLGLFDSEGAARDALKEGEAGVVVLDQTPFYAESGGQVGDHGRLIGNGKSAFAVHDTLVSGAQFIHVGKMITGSMTADAQVQAEVDVERREKIRRNHSATHLLHAALRQVLGTHVQQKGSLVNDEKLRFDFSHSQAMSPVELERVEDIVNEQIRSNTAVATQMMSYDDAIEHGAMALFGEKYGDEVRVLTMGDGFSVELCGGTHVARTGDIGLLKVTAEAGIASGVRRIEAVTGAGAMALIRQTDQQLQTLSAALKSTPASLLDRVEALQQDNRQLTKQLAELNQKLAAGAGADLAQSAVDVPGAKFLAAKTDGDAKSMMQTLDNLKSKLGTSVLVLASQQGDKLNLVVAVSKDLTDKISAPDVLNAISPIVGIKGGGRPDMARAGGVGDARHLEAGFSAALELVERRLG